jgi:tRNA(fMet)-specific endonuclease VapC
LIDASILIEHERGRLDLAQHLAPRQQEEFFLSVVTASERLHGV